MGTGRLDYAKAKRRAAARHGELITPAGPFRSSLQGWRTEWDGDPFPVTTSLIKAGDNTMDAKDYNGHTPDPEPEPEPGADESPACCSGCLREDPAYQLGWREGVDAVLAAIRDKAVADVDAVLEQLGERQAA